MANNFTRKKKELEILENLLTTLIQSHESEHYGQNWECVGKCEEQAYTWRNGEEVLLWEDEEQTIPKYRDKWDYVDREEGLNDDEQAFEDAYSRVMRYLEAYKF